MLGCLGWTWTHCSIENDNQQGPAVQHRGSVGVIWQPGREGSLGESGHVCVWPSPFAARLKHSQYCWLAVSPGQRSLASVHGVTKELDTT